MQSFKNEDGRTIVRDDGKYFSIYHGHNWYNVDELGSRIQFQEIPFTDVLTGSDTFFIMQLHYVKKGIIFSEIVENLVKLHKGEMPFVHIEPGKLVVHYLSTQPKLVILTREAFFMSDYTGKKWAALVNPPWFSGDTEYKQTYVSKEPVLLAFVRMLLEDSVGNNIQIPRLEEVVSKEEIQGFLAKYGEFSEQSQSE